MEDKSLISDELQERMIAQIVELQREYHFENKNKDSERRRKLREIIERATPQDGE
jgi:ribosomal protein S15P/S13E